MDKNSKYSRRKFLGNALRVSSAAIAFPYIIPSSALGAGLSSSKRPAPSDRIVLAAIGTGRRGRYNLGHFLKQGRVQCVMVCDTMADRRKMAKDMVDNFYDNKDCVATRFQEEVLERDDIDAVSIASGDRWHAVHSAQAARAGKDVYSEKPVTLTIDEGQKLVDTCNAYGTVWQCGTQRRSNQTFKSVVKAVQDGLIGKVHTITTSFGGPWSTDRVVFAETAPQPDPEEFDYDRWLGQAPWAPYSELRVRRWRNNWATGGGVITDMGPHYLETALWALNSKMPEHLTFSGEAKFAPDGFYNVPDEMFVKVQFGDVAIKMDNGKKAVKFEGDMGWIYLDDAYGRVEARPRSILQHIESGFHDMMMAEHLENFLNCMISRKQPVSNPNIAQKTHMISHCANLSLRLGRSLTWETSGGRFVGDEEANLMRSRAMRPPWGTAFAGV